jgi:leucyl aminopeptidase
MTELNIVFIDDIDNKSLLTFFVSDDEIKDYFKIHNFSGKKKEMLLVPKHYLKDSKDTLLISISELKDDFDACYLGAVARSKIKLDCLINYETSLVDFSQVNSFTLGMLLSGYKFEKYLNKKNDNKEITFDKSIVTSEQQVTRDAIYFVRDLVNTPTLDKTPEYFIDEVQKLIQNEDISLDIHNKEWLQNEGFGGVIGVSQGSAKEPYLLVGEYNKSAKFKVSIIGKGVLFDTGGYSLKSPSGMETMKTDMAGAATAWAIIKLAASFKLNIGVKVFTPLVENMVSSTAIRPGDVLTMRNKKTIEVLNTDAEGRLIMADALAYASEENPNLLCDVATLTGASYVALGLDIGAVFSNDMSIANNFVDANKNGVESYHALPLFQNYKKLVKSDIADLKNTGGRFGGAITAALILEEFVNDIPWIHLDMAGPARSRNNDPLAPTGGTGFGVIGFINFLKTLS